MTTTHDQWKAAEALTRLGIALKPLPCCEGKSRPAVIENDRYRGRFRVTCYKCRAKGPFVHGRSYAIALWNVGARA